MGNWKARIFGQPIRKIWFRISKNKLDKEVIRKVGDIKLNGVIDVCKIVFCNMGSI